MFLRCIYYYTFYFANTPKSIRKLQFATLKSIVQCFPKTTCDETEFSNALWTEPLHTSSLQTPFLELLTPTQDKTIVLSFTSFW